MVLSIIKAKFGSKAKTPENNPWLSNISYDILAWITDAVEGGENIESRMSERADIAADALVSIVTSLRDESPFNPSYEIYQTEAGFALIKWLLQWVTHSNQAIALFKLLNTKLNERWYSMARPSAQSFITDISNGSQDANARITVTSAAFESIAEEKIAAIADEFIFIFKTMQDKSPLVTNFEIYQTRSGFEVIQKLLQWVTNDVLATKLFNLLKDNLHKKWYSITRPSSQYFIEDVSKGYQNNKVNMTISSNN